LRNRALFLVTGIWTLLCLGSQAQAQPLPDSPDSAAFCTARLYDLESQHLAERARSPLAVIPGDERSRLKAQSLQLWKRAETEYEALVAKYPESFRLREYLGLGLTSRADIGGKPFLIKGLVHLEEASRLKPGDFPIETTLARVYLQLDRNELAAAHLQTALDVAVRREDTHRAFGLRFLLAQTAEHARVYEEAAGHYGTLADLLADNPWVASDVSGVQGVPRHAWRLAEKAAALHLRTDRPLDAHKWFRSAVLMGGPRVRLTLGAVRSLVLAKQLEDAAVEAAGLFEDAGVSPENVAVLVRICEAAPEFSAVLAGEVSPLSPVEDRRVDVELLRSGLMALEGKTDEALRSARAAVAAAPELPAARLAVVRTAAALERFEDAVGAILWGLRRDINDPHFTIELHRLLNAVDPDEAVALSLAALGEDLAAMDAAQLYVAALLARMAEDTDTALGAFRDLLEMSPDAVGAYHGAIAVLLKRDEFDEVTRLYDRALANKVETALITRGRAYAQFMIGNYELALESQLRAIALGGSDVAAIAFLAEIHNGAGRKEKCESILQQLHLGHPDDPVAANALAYFFANENKNLEEALELVQQALESDPDSGAYVDTLGWIYFRMERYDDALAALQRAQTLLQDPEVAAHIGDVYAATDREAQAAPCWRQALEMPGASKALKDALHKKLQDIGDSAAP